MKIAKTILLCICLAGLSQIVWSQNTSSDSTHGIPGYLDPRTGSFKPMAPPLEETPNAATITPTTGVFRVSFTIDLSPLPPNELYTCTVIVGGYDVGTGQSFAETASVAVTKAPGVAFCAVDIRYSWTLGTPGSDTVKLSFQISAVAPSNGLPQRSTDQGIATIKVP